jgi:hypothetical protein
MHTTISVVRLIALLPAGRVGGGGSTASAVSLGWGLSVAGALPGRDGGHPALCARCGLDRVADHQAAFRQVIGHPHARLEDHVHRARMHGFQQRFRAFLGQRGAHHHRHRALLHQLAQKRDAIHARHFHVQRDDVWHLLLEMARGRKRVGRSCHDFHLRVFFQDGLHRLAHAGAVVDDHDSDLAGAIGLAPLEYGVADGREREIEARDRFRVAHKQVASRHQAIDEA